MKDFFFILLAVGPFVLGANCGCQANDKPDFKASDCKIQANSAVLSTSVESDQYNGLTCISYSVGTTSVLDLDIVNFWGNCGAYQGYIEDVSKHAANLMVRMQDCDQMARCSCPYDFEVKIDGVALNSDVTLSIGDYSCADKKVTCTEKATLHLGTSPSGMACRYSGAGEETGKLHNLCISNSDNDSVCDEGLKCADVTTLSGSTKLCLSQCSTDADCPSPKALRCAEDGLCRIATELTRNCVDF